MSETQARDRVLSDGERQRPSQKFPHPAAAQPAATGASSRPEGPLSFAQEGLWFMEQAQPGTALYNLPQALRIVGQVDIARLHRALHLLVQRHAALRTIFDVVDGGPRQRVRPMDELHFPVVDISALTNGSREERVGELVREEAARPFNLASDPLFRAALLRLRPDEHILLLTIHHIACDLWSFTILFGELSQLYSTGAAAAAPAASATAIAFANAERALLAGVRGAKLRGYWLTSLSDAPIELALPLDYRRPAVQRFRGAVVTRSFTPALCEKMKAHCLRVGVSPYMFFLTIFACVLHRYTGQPDLLIGTPVARRSRAQWANLVGFLVNTIVVRSQCPDERTFEQHLDIMRDTVLDGVEHQEFPFEKIVEVLRAGRDASRHPVFQVMFQYGRRPSLPRFDDARVEMIEVRAPTAKFDLTLSLVEDAAGVAATAEYNTDLFECGTVERLLTHVETLATAALREPGRRIARLQMLTDAEERQLLVEWNNTAAEFPRNQTVHALFAKQAARTPQAVALNYGSVSLTYGELDERSNRLAHGLREHGVVDDVLVGVALERSPEMIVAWLAVLKAGGAYVPLDPDSPGERLAFIVNDARMPVVITEAKLVSRLPPTPAQILCLDWLSRESSDALRAPPRSAVSSESLAYVIYTSGSTGEPKGVAIPHRAISRLVFNSPWMQFSPEDRIAQVSNSAFDAATFEVWGALLHGGCIVGLNGETILSPAELENAIAERGITAMFLTVALFNRMAIERPAAFRPLKYLLFGGDAADPRCVREVLANGPPKYLQNGYGPTECTTFATWYRVTSVAPDATTVPIGRPIANTTCYILDRHQQPTPIGVPGELYIGGAGVARGYWNRPELTAERFIRSPFSRDENDRLYRTGDFVRYRPDGNLEFLGRIDRQVKVRGFRIELEEIETVLGRHPAVSAAVVLAREDMPGGKQLVAYIVGANGHTPGAGELRAHCRHTLPAYMVPSVFVMLERLPVTANGKIDRRSLPRPAVHTVNLVRDRPAMHLENQIARLWAEVLGVPEVGPGENFFELGGHSLLAVSLFTRLEKMLGHPLPVSLLFQAPTVESLAAAIRNREWRAPGATLVEIQPHGSRPPFFWLHTLGGGGGAGLFAYEKLARLLGPHQPSYGFVSPPQPFANFEEMAAHYVEEMRTVQPEGPYHLGGYCFGGVLAYEMARQLAAAGGAIAMVALLESAPPHTPLQPVRRSFDLLAHLARVGPAWSADMVRRPGALVDRLQRHGGRLGRKAGELVGALAAEERAIMELGCLIDMERYPPDFRHRAELHWQALRNYRPKPYPGPLTLFRTPRSQLLTLNPEDNWRRLSPHVEVIIVSGTHEDILGEPHVAQVAAELTKRLGKLR